MSEWDDELATPADAMREYAQNVGSDNPSWAWVLTPYDVWMPNPYYMGEPQPHPDDAEELARNEYYARLMEEGKECKMCEAVGDFADSICLQCDIYNRREEERAANENAYMCDAVVGE
jgi:hypothetical protein